MSNQAWQITSPNNLTLTSPLPLPTPSPTQSLVRMHSISLNYRDALVLSHSPSYIVRAKPSLIPCCDGAGTITHPGSNSIWQKGEKVFFHPNTWHSGSDPRDFDIKETLGGGEVDGTLARFVVADDTRLIRAPEGLGLEEVSTIYTAGVTAWNALRYGVVKVESGMKVLTMGTGGVSCYAIQIASAMGATVIATSSSDDKLSVAKSLGATHLVNYRNTPDWAEEVLRLTGGQGVDIVVDVVGAQSIEQSLRATRQGGLVSLVGMLSEDPNAAVNVMPSLLFGSKTIQGMLGAGSREMAEELVRFMEQHQIHPQIAQTFPFEQADQALHQLGKPTAPGKIVVKV